MKENRSTSFKICLVSISLGKGGAERSCALLSQMLENHGHRVHIVILTDEIDYEYSGKLFNLGKWKPKNDSFLKRLVRFKRLRDYLKKNHFDVIIDHRPKNGYAREVFYDQYLYRGISRIYVVHNSNKANYFTRRPHKMARIYNKNIMNIAVSKYIETEILEKLEVKKHCTVHNPFDPSWYETTVGGEVDKKPYILWYGRMQDAHKDISFLIEAFQISEIWKKNIRLIIMGEGKDKIKLKEKADRSPAHNFITFLPFTNNPFPYIYSARAMALTSRHEGFPMVLVESLSMGTPVISLDIVSGPSEVVQHEKNGLLIEGRDPKKFAEAMRKMCFDDDLYQTCKKNAKNSVAHFSMEIIGEKWDMLLSENIRDHGKIVR